ncbi:hypothetical protein SEA_SHELLEY_77 [Gordonia phage Shelley]|nr:hypothetical protein SEA_SHELLEY_77 [Gordonia phage Shelley]
MTDSNLRFSHRDCRHENTGAARAKCRESKLRKLELKGGLNPPPREMGVSELAGLLAQALEEKRDVERRLEEAEVTVELVQESLTGRMLHMEPALTADGEPPVIAFRKTWRSTPDKAYHYAAIGIPETRQVQGTPNCGDTSCPGETEVHLRWHLSSGSSARYDPVEWSELIKFMGVGGLETLQVLRAG